MTAITRPRGTNDLLPADAALWEWLLETHARVAGLHGYELIETPAFEATEMYERGTGAGTDVVEKEMFSFTDRGGRSLTLRPEMTPGVVRAVLGAHLDQERRPVRVRYAGPMFRYAKPQAGRHHRSGRSASRPSARSHRPSTPRSSRSPGASTLPWASPA